MNKIIREFFNLTIFDLIVFVIAMWFIVAIGANVITAAIGFFIGRFLALCLLSKHLR